MSHLIQKLINPERVYSRNQVLEGDCPVPKSPGIYAWYFEEIPTLVPECLIKDCIKYEDKTLLYVGIAPRKPPKKGVPSRRTLRGRIRYHFTGNAYGSTLRKSLGCLLSDELGLEFLCRGSRNRFTLTKSSEERLSNWMGQHAFVTWVKHLRPWELEHLAISSLSPPLNLKGNKNHPFYTTLSSLRRKARENARQL